MNRVPCLVAALLAPLTALGQPASQDLYLEVTVNGISSGQLLRFREGADGLRTSAASLRALGVDIARLGLDAQADDIALGALPGLRYDFDRARQSVALVLDDALREPLRLDARQTPPPPAQSATPGLLLNYDVIGELRPARSAIAFNEVRYFNEHGVFSSTGLLTVSPLRKDYLRYDSAWTWADPATLRVLKVGDAISSSLPWSRAVRFGGVQWRKSFELRPDLLTYPVASLNGSAAVPSAVSVYVNGIQQFRARCRPAPSWSTGWPASAGPARPPSSRATSWGAARCARCRSTSTRACWPGACRNTRWRRVSCARITAPAPLPTAGAPSPAPRCATA